jgi:hypothetical protein
MSFAYSTVLHADLMSLSRLQNMRKYDSSIYSSFFVTPFMCLPHPLWLLPDQVSSYTFGFMFQSVYAFSEEGLPDFRRYSEDLKYYLSPGRFTMNTAYVEVGGIFLGFCIFLFVCFLFCFCFVCLVLLLLLFLLLFFFLLHIMGTRKLGPKLHVAIHNFGTL